MIKNIILSFRIVFFFMLHGEKSTVFLQNLCSINEPDLLKAKLKRISAIIAACFPMTFIIIFEAIGFSEKLLIALDTKAEDIVYIIMFPITIVLGLILLGIVLVAYVLYFLQKHQNNQ